MGAVTLGNKTNKDFLRGIIPNNWEQIVYEHITYWSVRCKSHENVTGKNYTQKEKEFDKICDKLKEEFGENLLEIYSISSAGSYFVVYLKKN